MLVCLYKRQHCRPVSRLSGRRALWSDSSIYSSTCTLLRLCWQQLLVLSTSCWLFWCWGETSPACSSSLFWVELHLNERLCDCLRQRASCWWPRASHSIHQRDFRRYKCLITRVFSQEMIRVLIVIFLCSGIVNMKLCCSCLSFFTVHCLD